MSTEEPFIADGGRAEEEGVIGGTDYELLSQVQEDSINGDEVVVSRRPSGVDTIVRPRTGTMIGAVFNLANSTLGAGILGLAYVVSISGLILGPSLLLVMAFLGDYSLRLLKRAGDICKAKTYNAMCQHVWGAKGRVFVLVATILLGFGSCCSYLTLIHDMLIPLLTKTGSDVATERALILLFVTVCFIVPLSLFKRVTSLRFLSLVSVMCVMVFVLTVIIKTFSSENVYGDVVYFKLDSSIFLGIPIFVFSYACHTNFFPIYSEMRDPKQAHTSIHLSIGTCAALYLLVSIFGYLTFYDTISGDLLSLYSKDDVVINCVRVVVAVSLILTYPLVLYPTRLCFDELLFVRPKGPPSRFRPEMRFVAETLVLIAATLAVGIWFPNVLILFSLTGNVAIFLSYILPAGAYVKLEHGPYTSWNKVGAIALIIAGCILGAISLVVNIIEIAS